MITCRCGNKFDNNYGEGAVTCPRCRRTYINMAPDMYHPKTADEMAWTCPDCKKVIPCFMGGLVTKKCIYCGSPRPGDPKEWTRY